jgi:hypothetical protein
MFHGLWLHNFLSNIRCAIGKEHQTLEGVRGNGLNLLAWSDYYNLYPAILQESNRLTPTKCLKLSSQWSVGRWSQFIEFKIFFPEQWWPAALIHRKIVATENPESQTLSWCWKVWGSCFWESPRVALCIFSYLSPHIANLLCIPNLHKTVALKVNC